MIEYFLGYLPKKFFLYVKEHPSQFLRRDGGGVKSTRFYKLLAGYEQVRLIDSNFDQYKLIDKSRGVITVNGTSALEAYIRNKFTMTFGHPWYRGEKGILSIHNSEDFTKFIENIQKDVNPENNIKSLHKYLFLGFHNEIDLTQDDANIIFGDVLDILNSNGNN